jgi:gliding motility-associated-like protein
MKKNIFLFFTFLSINFIYSQATCNSTSPICSGNITPRPSLSGPNLGSPGCLGSAPNANWYTFQTGFAGDLIFNLHQGNNAPLYNNLDIDFICWGPFTDAQMASGACTSLADLTAPVSPNNIVACSYSAAATETITILNANPGSNYILLITNFSGQPGQFVMEQTNSSVPGSGSTNCDVVCGVNLGSTSTSIFPDPPAINTISICDSTISSYTLHCNFENPPANQGTLAYQWFLNGVLDPTKTTKSVTVNQSGTWKVVVTHPDCGTPSEDSVNIYFGSTPVLNTPPTQLGPLGDCNPTFDLTSLIPSLFTAPQNPADYTVSFFDDFGASIVYSYPVTGNITNPSAYQPNPAVDTVIYVRARNNTSPECVDADDVAFLLDVRCTNNATATGNTICIGNTGQLTFSGPPGAVVTFTEGSNTYNVTLNASGSFVWDTPLPLVISTTYNLTNVAAGSPVVNTPLTSTATITVLNNNTVTAASSTPTLCVNTALSPVITHNTTGATGIGASIGLPTGVTASWAGNLITINGTPTATGTFNYTISLTGGCGAVSATGTIIVTPNNTVTAASSTPTLCVNTPLTIAITHVTTGATGIGTSTGLPAGVTASWVGNIITISGTPTTAVGSPFNYTIPLTGGCGSINATGTITVTPDNTVTAASITPTLCVNTLMLTSITHGTTGATGIGAATGLPAGVAASWALNTITISGTPTATGIFNYTIPLTGGCGTFSATGTITVNPNNTVTVASSTPTLCVNSLLTPINHTTTGATGIGTSTGLPAGVTASWTGNIITISGTPTTAVGSPFNYSIPLTGGCGVFNAIGTITVTPENTVTAASATPVLCVNTLLTPITHSTTGATGIGAPIGLPAGVTALWAGGTITISGTPTTAVGSPFNYIIPLTGGCGTVSATGTITVNSNNTVAAASYSPTLCVNTLLTPTVTHATTGATGIGVTIGLPAGVTASWLGDVITISGTPTATGIFNYTIPLTGGCGAFSATGTITVNPSNTVSAASSTPTLCTNTLLTPITHTTTGATGIGAAIDLPAGVTASWLGGMITISGTPTATGTFNYSIPLTGGCGGTATGTITVTPVNTVTAASTMPTLCVNTPLTPITHTTTGATSIGVATGLPAGVTATWLAVGTISISGTPSVTGTFNYTVPLTGGCGVVSATGTITVNSNNTVSAASSTPTLCVNTPLSPSITHTTTGATGIGTPTGLPAGVIASWSAGTITISGTPTTTVGSPFNYTIPLTGGCGTYSAIGTITVIPSNTVTAALSNPTLCVNTLLTPITHTTTGATGIGTATGLPAGVTASWLAGTITISGTPTTTVGSPFTYTIPLTGGCGAVNATGTITVNPAPTNISISGSTTTCAGIPVNVTVTATPGTVITWTGTPGSFTIGASGSNVISVSPTINTTYTLTSASLNGCTIPVIGQSATVTVSATPQFITQIPDIIICNGGTLNIASQLTSTVPGATFVWSATTSNVNTTVVSGDQTNIDQVVNLINTLQNGTVNIEVKPQIGSCFGTSQQILITVKPIPVITSTVANKTVICNNESVIITSISNSVATQYNWQVNTATGVQIVGGATSGTSTTGIINLQLALLNPLQSGTISFNFTPVNGICTGATITNAVTITVNPIPGTPIGLPVDTICSGGTTSLTISTFPVVTGTTLEWTVIDSQNVTGFTNGTATAPHTINDVLINTSNVQGYVKYSVTSKLGTCDGGTTEYIVKVNPLPKPVLIDGHICVNQTTGVTYQGYVLDTQLSDPNFTYDWYILNTTTGLYDALPSSNSATYEATVAGTYQVIVTNTATTCTAEPVQAIVVTVYPATAFTAVVTEAFTNDATITVTVNPVGTGNLIYSLDGGAWQVSNVFTGVEAGTHEITVEDLEGCTNLTQTIEVIDYPKYFTPNGDGIHDTWNVVGLNQSDAKLYIYDRYGKLIKQLSATDNSPGWDGTYNGHQAPSTDYWFTIDFTENNQQKQFKAHFSLKR